MRRYISVAADNSDSGKDVLKEGHPKLSCSIKENVVSPAVDGQAPDALHDASDSTDRVLWMMRWTSKAPPELRNEVCQRFQEEGIRTIKPDGGDIDDESLQGTEYRCQTWGLTTSLDNLEHTAQAIRLLMKRRDNQVLEPFDVEQKDQYVASHVSASDASATSLFSSKDRGLLMFRMLTEVNVLDDDVDSSSLTELFDKLGVEYYKNKPEPMDASNLDDEQKEALMVPLDQARSAPSTAPISTEALIMPQHALTKCLYQVLEDNGYVDVLSPVHQYSVKEGIWRQLLFSSRTIVPKLPIQNIRDYYGEEIAFYFGWMGFLVRWLLISGALGVVAYVIRLLRHDEIQTDEFAPLYGFICYYWSVLFVQFWEQQECRWSYQWGVLVGEYEKSKYFMTRPQFVGTQQRISRVTGRLEYYYPPYQRHLQYIKSGIVTVLILTVACGFMVVSLNLQGYIHPNHDEARWNSDNAHPFYVPRIAQLAQPGEVFDAESWWRSLLPIAIHVGVIFGINKLYRIIATHMTEWENHETQLAYQNSLILKRFLFEAFACYLAFLYLAFYERDIAKLRSGLVAVFNMDTLRRLTMECLVPYLLRKFHHSKGTYSGLNKENHTKLNNSNHNSVATGRSSEPSQMTLEEEAELDEYDQFDDYMEIVIQFGYVTLFASAYPLASVVSIIANSIEIRSDCFKLTYLCRRPRCIRSDGLNMWKHLLGAIVRLGALSNCLIFGFTSGQLKGLLPSFYETEEDGEGGEHVRFRAEKSWVLIFLLFGLERALLYGGSMLRAAIPRVPEDVMNELERKHFVTEEETRMYERSRKKKVKHSI